ncbi:MAG: hypothetical protein GX542_05140, partial [Rhodococcus sp.]|nr:hypothetical protein [Rhodococcus sp. (in: high G+C Gram-positive bacteria)]
RFLLTMLFFNRVPIHPDIEQVLGPFASSTLLDVDVDHADFGGAVRAFAGAVAQVLDHGLISGVEVARELARHKGTRSVPAPVVFTSTVGFRDAARDGATSRIDPSDVYERVRTPQVLVDCQVAEENGQLVCNLDAAEAVFDAVELDAVIEHIEFWAMRVARSSDAFTVPLDVLHRDDRRVAATVGAAAGDGTGSDKVGENTSQMVLDPAVVTAVTELWSEFTDVEDLSIESDFFAAGGDSLSMIRLLAAIRAQYEIRIAPADFLTNPTIAAVAARIADAQRTADPATLHVDAVITLSDMSEGGDAAATAGVPVYLLHPSGGDVLCYVGLARALAAHPVYALSDPELSGDLPAGTLPRDIGTLSRLYADVIARHSGGGPLVIGGWSMGGTVGHEVASILVQDHAIEVAAIVMVDSNVPDHIRRVPGHDAAAQHGEVAIRYLGSLEAFTGAPVCADFDGLRAQLVQLPIERQLALMEQRLSAAGLPATNTARKLDTFARHLHGLGEHGASAADVAPVLLIRAEQKAPHNSGVGMGVDDTGDAVDLGWGPYVGRLVRYDVDAHHYSILNRPALDVVSEIVQKFFADYLPVNPPGASHSDPSTRLDADDIANGSALSAAEKGNSE